MGYYTTAQICLNGHVITNNLEESPEFTERFCSTCGKPTITTCQSCRKRIRGSHHEQGVIGYWSPELPMFCPECGKAYPWTESKLLALKETVELAEGLTLDEKAEMNKSLETIVTNGPGLQPAAIKYRNLAKKAGVAVADATKQIIVEIASEAVKKVVFGP